MAGQIYTGVSTPSLGANLGSALGQGLLGGIQNIIDLRTKKMQQQESEKAFIDLGYSQKEAKGLSKMDPQFQKEYLTQKSKGASSQQSYNLFSRFLPPDEALALASAPTPVQNTVINALINRGAFVPGQGVPQTQTAQSMNNMGTFGLPQGGGLEALQVMQPQGGFDILQQLTPQLNLLPQNMQAGGLSALQQMTPGNQPGNLVQPPISGQDKGTLAEILSRPYESPTEKTARLGREQAERQFIERQALAEKKANQKDKEVNLQETREYRTELEKLYKADKDEAKQRKIARKLNEKGDLTSPILASILKTAGLDWDALKTADSQIIGSMIEPALKKLKPTFGGNTSNRELLTILATHWSDPTKSKLVREFMIDIADANSAQLKAEHDTYRNIMKETNGNPPIDLRNRVDEAAEPVGEAAYDALEQKWLARFGAAPATAPAPIQSLTNAPVGQTTSSQQQPQQGLLENPLVRGAARTGARALESLAGLGGDVLGGTLGLANYASSGAIPTYQTIQNALEERGIPHLPTSSQLREVVTKGLTGQALEPKGKLEEFVDDVVSDISTLALPIKGKIPLKSAAVRALGGNFASWATKELGGGPLAQAGAKLGVMTLASFAGGKKALNNNMKESYDAAEKIASGVKEDAKSLSSKVNSLLRQSSKGASTPEKEIAKNFLLDVDQKIGAGTKIALDEVTQLKRDVNKILYSPKTAKETAHLLKPITAELDGLIKQYASKSPEFAQNFYRAEDIWRGLKTQSRATDFLNKHVNLEKLTVAKAVLGLGGGALLGVPKAAAAAVGALGVRQGARAWDLITKSSEVRKYYANTLKAALEQNAPAALREAKKLDAVAKKRT